MKNILKIIICSLFILSLFMSSFVNAQTTKEVNVQIGDNRVTTGNFVQGEKFIVHIATRGFTDVNYDSSSMVITWNEGSVSVSEVYSGMVLFGEDEGLILPVIYNTVGNECHILTNASGTSGINDNMDLAIIEFEVTGVNATLISIEELVVSDINGNSIDNIIVNSASVSMIQRGDANMDGKINALDITATERQVVLLDARKTTSDINGDGLWDARDVTLCEKRVAGLY